MAEVLRQIVQKVEERTGLILTHGTRDLEKKRQAMFEEADNKLLHENIDDLVSHSDACMSEIDYLFGARETDPHPDHQVIFDANASDASRLL